MKNPDPKTLAILQDWHNGADPACCPGLAEILYHAFGDKAWRHFSQWLLENLPDDVTGAQT
jgi:hypothetical protein